MIYGGAQCIAARYDSRLMNDVSMVNGISSVYDNLTG